MALTRVEITKRYNERNPDRVAARRAKWWPAYYEANREKFILRAKEWSNNNPDKVRAIKNKWYAVNRTQAQQSQDRYRKSNSSKYLFGLAKRRAAKRGIEFNIELCDVVVPKTCPLLNIPINSYSEHQDFRPSLDRINPKLGYIKGNVIVISHKANRIKSNANASELFAIAMNLMEITGELP